MLAAQTVLARRRLRCLAAAAGILTLAGCAAPPSLPEPPAAARRAAEAGWRALDLPAGEFVLRALVPPTLAAGRTLRVYVEGDGRAWVNTSTPSIDPTPRQATGLELALADPSGQAVYLARPCQYVTTARCIPAYWTSHRFAPEVIAATDAALEQLRARYPGRDLILTGYSGGAAVAALVAARRQDVAGLITVAGNLDPDTWTRMQQLSPLSGSLNPAAAWPQLITLPQIHWVGAADTVVPQSVARAFAERFPPQHRPPIVVRPGFDHACCWQAEWPAILAASETHLNAAAKRPPRPAHLP